MSESVEKVVIQARQARKEKRPAESRDLYQRAADIARGQCDALALLHCLRHLSELNRQLGSLELAVTQGDEAVLLARSTPGAGILDLANAVRVHALAHQLLGHHAEARSGWNEMRSLSAQAGIEAGVAEADRNLASMGGATAAG